MFQAYVVHFFDEHLFVQPEGVRMMISRAWTLAEELYQETQDSQDLDGILRAIVDNYRNDESSITGRVNQMFHSYVIMLEAIGHYLELEAD